MSRPTALILTAAGINCERELAHAFEVAGAAPAFVHLNDLLAKPGAIERFNLIGLPGGFSYGDAVAAGRVMAQIMRQRLYQPLVKAIERGVPIIAPCNGFQIAVQMGLLPGPPPGASGGGWPDVPPTPTVALGQNETGRFIDRWCRVEIPSDTRCIWTQGLSADEDARMLPIAHGEGRFIVANNDVLSDLRETGRIAIRYAADDNPNGSIGDIAGICDSSGLVFGLMPHPERSTRWEQHPWWTRLNKATMEGEPLGLAMFRKAIEHVRQVVA